ncbi:MAG: beta-N-acetylhexosaminidase [Paracoccaceae bacterium]|nr:beta-N-acetylhexosaminidase [Paracoccaceae bacterium]
MATPGATILGCLGPVLSADEAAFFREADPWGFILFARNVEGPNQLRRLTSDLRAVVGREAPVLVDQEGGRVQRLRAPHWREWVPALEEAARGGARAMRLRFRMIAAELRAVGIDVNCAPVLDIATEATHPFLRNRCYGFDAETVTAMGRAVAEGVIEGGVLPVMKHMPGHGRAAADTHKDLPTVEATLDQLRATDFAPFRALADLPMAMTAHIVFPALDPARPVTQSPEGIAMIRNEIGFDGLLISDDLNMEALSGTLGARAAAAIGAGCDVALHCNGEPAEMAEVVAAAGRLTPEAEARADAALARRTTPQDVDMGALSAEFEALVNG